MIERQLLRIADSRIGWSVKDQTLRSSCYPTDAFSAHARARARSQGECLFLVRVEAHVTSQAREEADGHPLPAN